MTREKMYEKYNDAMMDMFKETGDDNSVCLDKLIYTLKHKDEEGHEVYAGIPTDFDWGEFAQDYAKLIG
jgi:hypothetical protein